MTESNRPQVLLVCSSEAERLEIREQIGDMYRVTGVSSIESAFRILCSDESVDMVLTDNMLPDGTGLQMLDEALKFWPPIPVIVMIDQGDEIAAGKALKQGAADFIPRSGTEALRLAQILSNALARSQAEFAAQQRARELGVLNAVLTALNHEAEEDPVLDTIVHEVMALMGTVACSIILVDHDSDQLLLRASTRLPVRDMVLSVPASKSIAGRVVREKTGCITLDVTEDPDWYSLGLEYTVDSMLTVPLLVGGDAIGVLQAINKSVGPFLPSDLKLMQSIAAVAAAAIVRGQHVAHIQETLQERAQRDAEVGRLGQAILDQIGAAAGSPLSSELAAIRQHAQELVKLVSE